MAMLETFTVYYFSTYLSPGLPLLHLPFIIPSLWVILHSKCLIKYVQLLYFFSCWLYSRFPLFIYIMKNFVISCSTRPYEVSDIQRQHYISNARRLFFRFLGSSMSVLHMTPRKLFKLFIKYFLVFVDKFCVTRKDFLMKTFSGELSFLLCI